MTAGFQGFDGSSRLTTDITDRFSLLMAKGVAAVPGAYYTGGNNGSVVVPVVNIFVNGLDASDNFQISVGFGGEISGIYAGYFGFRQNAYYGSWAAMNIPWCVWRR